MSKHIKAKRTARATDANAAARKIWLAGLGAVSLAQKQGTKLVETLVDEGEQFRSRGEKYVNGMSRDVLRAAEDAQKRVKAFVTPIRKRAEATARRVEGVVSDRLGELLGRFGVPSKSEVEELSDRVGTLNRDISTGTRKRKTATRKSATRKAATRKRAA